MSANQRLEPYGITSDRTPSREVIHPPPEDLQDSSRPIILSVLSTAESFTLAELELIVRKRSNRLLPSDQFERDLEDLCFASLVEMHGHWKCRLTTHGMTVGQNLVRKMLD